MDPALFGSRLRLARERRRLTFKDLEAQTKLHASLFESLEEGTCRGWPIGVFSRSHVRTYAELVGLDGDEVVADFSALFPHLAWSDQDRAPEVAAVRRAPLRVGMTSAPLRLVIEDEPVPLWRTLMTRFAWLLHRAANGVTTPEPVTLNPEPDVANAGEQGEATGLVPFTG